MKEEVEIKVILKNPKEIEKILQKKAKFIKEKNQKDEYFIPKHKNFFSENPTIEYFRIRHEDANNSIAYFFCHLAKDKTLLKTDEYETNIENPRMMAIILKKLDIVNKVTVTKHRKHFEYKDFEILIDYIKELGYFLEIEAKKLLSSFEETRNKCYELLEELGAKWENAPNMGYPNMILAKK